VKSAKVSRQALFCVLTELLHSQRQLESQRWQLAQSEQACVDLRRRDADVREAVAAKDAQIAVLRTRLDEADRDIATRTKQLSDLGSTQDRWLYTLSDNVPLSMPTPVNAKDTIHSPVMFVCNKPRPLTLQAIISSGQVDAKLPGDRRLVATHNYFATFCGKFYVPSSSGRILRMGSEDSSLVQILHIRNNLT